MENNLRHANWIWNKSFCEYQCSRCGCTPIYEMTLPDMDDIDKYKFCRWCGAKMEVKDPVIPHGYWIHDEDWECSVCHTHFSESKFAANDYGTPLYNYCPICGANLTGV